MRFQSTASFSKLSPTYIADGQGPCVGASASTASGSVVLLAPPPAGSYYQIFALSANAATSANASTAINIHTTAGGIDLIASYAQANGINLNYPGNMLPINDGLTLTNNTGVGAFAYCMYRTVPNPP